MCLYTDMPPVESAQDSKVVPCIVLELQGPAKDFKPIIILFDNLYSLTLVVNVICHSFQKSGYFVLWALKQRYKIYLY